MESSFKELIAPLSEAEFVSLLRARSLAFQRASSKNRLGGLPNWQTLRHLIESGLIHPRNLLVTRKTEVLPPIFYLENGKVSANKIMGVLQQGASLIIKPLEMYVPSFQALCRDIKAIIPEDICVGAIVTTGIGGAFKNHYDEMDLILIQIEGTKRWKIHGPPVVNPIESGVSTTREDDPLLFDDWLHPGDFLFLPAGYWHHCENGPELSLHLGIFFLPPTGYSALKATLAQLAKEEIFRTPVTRVEGRTERRELQAAIRSLLMAKFEETSTFELLAEETRGNGDD